MSTLTRPISRLIHRSIRQLTNLGRFIGWELVNISSDISVECLSICLTIYQSRGAQNTHDPSSLYLFKMHEENHVTLVTGNQLSSQGINPKGNPFVTKHASWDCSWGHWERDVGVFSMYCCYGNLWYKKDDHNLLGSEWGRCVISLSLVLSDKEFTDPSKCKCWIKQATVISHPRTGPLKKMFQ